MSTLAKRTTVYLEPSIYKLLKLKSVETEKSVSELIDIALKHEFSQDEEDLRAFDDRLSEPTVSYETMLKDLKKNGKI